MMKNITVKCLVAWSIIITSISTGLGQNFTSLNDYSGISLSTYSEALNDTASTVLDVFPDTDYNNDFEIYETNHYVPSTKFEETIQEQFDSYIESRTDLKNNYIVFGRFHFEDGTVKIFSKSKLPSDGVYACLDEIRNTIDQSTEAIILEAIGGDYSIGNIANAIGLGIRNYRIQFNHYLNCVCALKTNTCEVGPDFVNSKLLGLGWRKTIIEIGDSYEYEPTGSVIDFAQTQIVRNGNSLKIPDEIAISKQIMDEELSLINYDPGFVVVLNNESFGQFGNEWDEFINLTKNTSIPYVVGYAIITDDKNNDNVEDDVSYLYTKNYFPPVNPQEASKPGSKGEEVDVENKSAITGNIFWDAVNQIGKPVAIDYFIQVIGNRIMDEEVRTSDSPWMAALKKSSILNALENVALDKLESLMFWKSDTDKFDLETEIGKIVFNSFATVVSNALDDIENYTIQKGIEDFVTASGLGVINILDKVPFIKKINSNAEVRRSIIAVSLQIVARGLIKAGVDNKFTDILIQGSINLLFSVAFEVSAKWVNVWKGLLDEDVDPSIMQNINALTDPDAAIDGIQTSQKSKPTWTEIQAFWKRGNDFNAKGRIEYGDHFVEVVLKGVNGKAGKRLDTYLPPINGNPGQIISRKATTLSNIQPKTFKNYLNELIKKYPKGAELNSSKFPKGTKLDGDYKLQIPESNKSFFESSDEFKKVLSDFNTNKGVVVEIIYLAE